MEKEYIPQPFILSKSDFPADVSESIEEMARNVHEEWAAGRIREGWRYGKERNDKAKQHPTLVPYDQLPESEKEFDRRTVIAALSVLMKRGFEIVRK